MTRLAVERVTEDVRAGLEGVARENAELRRSQAQLKLEQEKQVSTLDRLSDKEVIKALAQEVWRQAGISGTALLVGQRMNSLDSRCPESRHSKFGIPVATAAKDGREGPQGDGDEERQFSINDVSKLVERLLGSVTRGIRLLEVGGPSVLALDQRVAVALERWTLDNVSSLFYLEAAAYSAEARLPQVTVAAARIVDTADKIGVPTISFFCDIPPGSEADQSLSDDEVVSVSPPLLGLVYSIIFQLTLLLPPLTDIGSLLTASQVASLNTSFGGWPIALEILSKLLTMAPPFLVCVIDGFYAFENPGMDSMPTHELLSVLQNAMEEEQKVLKVLFTNSRRAFSLVQAIPQERREIVEGTRTAGSGRGRMSAGRAVLDLRMDMTRNL